MCSPCYKHAALSLFFSFPLSLSLYLLHEQVQVYDSCAREREGEREEEQHESVVSTTADARLAGPEVSSDNKSNKYNPCYPHTI